MTLWPKCLIECPNWPTPNLDAIGMMHKADTPQRIYHGMNLTYVCQTGKMMEDGNTTFNVPCEEGVFKAPRKWPVCLTICNATDTNPQLDTAQFVRCIEDQEGRYSC